MPRLQIKFGKHQEQYIDEILGELNESEHIDSWTKKDAEDDLVSYQINFSLNYGLYLFGHETAQIGDRALRTGKYINHKG